MGWKRLDGWLDSLQVWLDPVEWRWFDSVQRNYFHFKKWEKKHGSQTIVKIQRT